jgi:hypothetical protein
VSSCVGGYITTSKSGVGVATLIVPVGHALGSYFSGPTIEPDSYDVRLGEDVHNLNFDEYTVWSIAHGFPELVGERRPSRPIIEAQATQLGIDNSPLIFQRLVNSGLIAPIALRRHMRDFAEQHRAYPLALGLGNSGENNSEFLIGRADQPLAIVAPDVFHLWSYLPRFSNLWQAATEVAGDLSTPDAEPLSPEAVLWSLTQALPTLLSMNCIYFDQS